MNQSEWLDGYEGSEEINLSRVTLLMIRMLVIYHVMFPFCLQLPRLGMFHLGCVVCCD